MRLELDIGNTRIKWRLCKDDTVVSESFVLTAEVVTQDEVENARFDSVFSGIDLSQLDAIYAASVVIACNRRLIEWCEKNNLCQPVFAGVCRECAGVINGYIDVSQMGVDRWLAMLAAWNKLNSPCIVIDAGSAITVDFIADKGKHCGGYIVPGLRLMNNALFAQTEKVGVSSDDYPLTPLYGDSTEQAVLSGLSMMVLGFLKEACDQFIHQTALITPPKILVTGGNGHYVEGLLLENDVLGGRTGRECEISYDPDLVLDGLSLALLENSFSHLD